MPLNPQAPKISDDEEGGEITIESLLATVADPPKVVVESEKEDTLSRQSLGSPGSVLGIHRENGFVKRPLNRKERIEMKILSQGA